jgi:hypothetical protein
MKGKSRKPVEVIRVKRPKKKQTGQKRVPCSSFGKETHMDRDEVAF